MNTTPDKPVRNRNDRWLLAISLLFDGAADEAEPAQPEQAARA